MQVGQGRIEHTVPARFSLDETFDVGADDGTPVVPDYEAKMPFAFTGTLNKFVVLLQPVPLAARIEPGKLQRVETPLIPHKAIREAFINALCHRDYSIRGGSIALAIYDDRMEIFSHGGLLSTLSVEQIKSGYSQPRNPLIAEVFYRGNMIEKWGRGVPDMIASCMAANDPEPEFISSTIEFKVVFRFPKSIRPPIISIDQQENIILTNRQQKIIEIFTDEEALNAQEIYNRLGEKLSLRTIKADLTVLKFLGFLEQQGRARNAVWKLIVK